VDAHRTAERRSLAYHREIAERVLRDQRIIDSARRRVQDWALTASVHARYVVVWRDLLALPVELLARRLVEDSDDMRALRQVSPFSGVLEPRVRWRIWRSVA
jgi:hypothetical protein